MSSLTPSKRQHNQHSNGKKSQKTSNNDSMKKRKHDSSESVVFRLLCPSSKIESMISQNESVITQICQESSAKVRLDDEVRGCDERVIVISSDNQDSKSTKEQGGSEHPNGNDESLKRVEDLSSKKARSSIQEALLLIFERFFEGEENDGSKEEKDGSGTVTLRLLVLSNQVGCLLGKGGSVIKQMCTDSGAQIRVLPRDKLPQCASSADEVVQIVGAADAVKKAIKSISDQILENSLQDNDSHPLKPSKPLSHSHSNPVSRPGFHPIRSVPPQGPTFGSGFHDNGLHSNVASLYPKFHENFMPTRMGVSDMLTFRLLCPDERVGGVIGKGGTIIKALQHETGCEIKVLEATSDGEERIIVVSGPVHPDDRISAVQDAILRVQHRIAKAIPDNKDKGVTAKLIVSSNQIGCLLGKGGSIIAEMRKLTGAHIRILGKDQNPKCVSENEEVVQINGDIEVVQEALLQISRRLQQHFFRDTFPSVNHPSNSVLLDGAPPLSSFTGRREFSPPRMFPNLGPSFRSFDPVGGPPTHGGFHLHDDHPPFMHDVHRQGISRIPSERPWLAQTIERDPMSLMDYVGAPLKGMSGFGGESQQAVITNTTVEVVVPSSLVPSIYGESGGCLRQIKQISEAKIIINDPKPGAPETMIVISGTPEQTHAAQSLVQAFVMIENESS